MKHGLDYLAKYTPQSNLAQYDAVMRVLQEAEMQKDFEAVFGRLGEVMRHAVAKGNLPAARKVYADLRLALEGMPDGAWRDLYLRTLQEGWGHLAQAPGVNLAAVDGVETVVVETHEED